MPTEVLGTVENGVLTLDAALPFRERTRVRLTIEPVEPQEAKLAAWERMLAMFDAAPIVDGRPFRREDLYERD